MNPTNAGAERAIRPDRALRIEQPDAVALLATTESAEPAFEAFYAGERSRIGRALAITLRDRELAGDAVDEAMARAYARWATVGRLDNPGGWVYRVGLNWSRSFLRRAMRPAPIWVTNPPVWSTSSPLDPAVDQALGELSVDQRAVVICRLLLGLSELETATALQLRPGTVKSRLHRGTQRLQTLLRDLHQPSDEQDSDPT
ncbi:MAG: sigma factor-like helix-turn-helix DNA-binding protein [Ilumatobacteraceae bacterium]